MLRRWESVSRESSHLSMKTVADGLVLRVPILQDTREPIAQMQASVEADHPSKKTTVGAMVFIAYATGNIIGECRQCLSCSPLKTQVRTSSSRMRTLLTGLGCWLASSALPLSYPSPVVCDYTIFGRTREGIDCKPREEK